MPVRLCGPGRFARNAASSAALADPGRTSRYRSSSASGNPRCRSNPQGARTRSSKCSWSERPVTRRTTSATIANATDAAVAVRGARPPVRPLPGQPPRDHLVVRELVGGEAAVDADHAGTVGEHVPQGDPVLARGGELRPVACHGLVQLQHAVLHEQRHRHRRGALGRGVDAGQGVAGDLVAGPQVDHATAVQVHRQLRAGVGGDHVRELLAHRLETRGHRSVDLDVAHRPCRSDRRLTDSSKA